MAHFPEQDTVDAQLKTLREVGWKEREAAKASLQETALGVADRRIVVDYLERQLKDLPLEIRWEVEEVLEALAPEPEPEATSEDDAGDEPDEGPADPSQLKMSDLDLVYDDPRGLMIYKHKTSDRWFAVQPDPATGQPRMFELHPSEVTQLKAQLQGSPYWRLGAG